MSDIKKDEITKALLKKAKGYNCLDVALEYVVDENENLKLSKKKVTKKHVSPDISAAKVLFEMFDDKTDELEKLSDDELEKKRGELIELARKIVEDDDAKNKK